jgi:hypothetical protein
LVYLLVLLLGIIEYIINSYEPYNVLCKYSILRSNRTADLFPRGVIIMLMDGL